MSTEELENSAPALNLTELARGVLRCALHLIHVGVILVAAAAIALCLQTRSSYTPVYQATASFAVRTSNPLYATQNYYNAATAEQMAQTFPSILTSGLLNQKVQQTLGISHVPAISARVLGSTNIFTLTVTSPDPQLAYDVLQCVIEIYPNVAEFVVGPTTLSLLDESGVPEAPINTMDLRGAAVRGAVLGAAAWIALSALYWLTHRTIGSEKELRQLVNLTCMGVLPSVGGKVRQRKKGFGYPKVTEDNDKFGFSESIRLLRVRVEKALARHNAKVLMITSTIANEGKTTVSMNLATALAQKGKKTLLVDCDLRNPSIAGALDVERRAGLSDFLQGREKITDLLCNDSTPNLFVIYGGQPIAHPEKLLASDATRNFLAAARNTFDCVILDTPPCTMMADASEVSTLADCTLLVIRQDFACRSQVVDGIQILGDSGKPIIGCVLNMTTAKLGRKRYSRYGHYGQ